MKLHLDLDLFDGLHEDEQIIADQLCTSDFHKRALRCAKQTDRVTVFLFILNIHFHLSCPKPGQY
jgi:hypothetical protein